MNGMNITELVVKIKELTDKLGKEAIEAIIEELDRRIKEAVRRIKTSTNEKINNITVLNMGKITPIYRILRVLKYAQVI
jgi:uncharacterized protein (UPF0248 family)